MKCEKCGGELVFKLYDSEKVVSDVIPLNPYTFTRKEHFVFYCPDCQFEKDISTSHITEIIKDTKNPKKVCLKYQEIEEKAIKLAKTMGEYNQLKIKVEISKDGLKVVFEDEIKDEWITEKLITWEELNDKI